MPSLQDQLLKAGRADEKKAKASRTEKRKKCKAQPKALGVAAGNIPGVTAVDEHLCFSLPTLRLLHG